jgi:hypothetical protein
MRRITKVTDAVTAAAVLREHTRRQMQKNRTLFDRSRKEIKAHDLDMILSRCHQKQRDLLLNPSRFKALLSPRRVGKTTYNLYEVLVHDKKYPRSMIAYIVPDSKAHAKDLFWLPMKELDEKLGLGLTFKEVEKRVITPNGTNILILGAHDADSPQRLRGNPYSLVLLDECKDFGPHFEELVVEAVLPGLDDYGGTLVLSGTPGNVFQGLFYKITTTDPEGWEVSRWIKSDNTFLRPEARDLQKVWETSYKPFGLGMDSPKFRREQKAEWVSDESEQAYLYNPDRNYFSGELNPLISYDHICGIDIGKRDKLVIQPAAFSAYDTNLTYLDGHAERGMYIETMVQKWREMNAKYHFIGTVVDTGGLGVMIVDDVNMRYGLNWQAAQKGNGYKLAAVKQMNSDFLLGRIKAHPDSVAAKAWARSIKCPKTGLPLHSDEGDAALYVHRYSYHWQGAPQAEKPASHSTEWWQEQEQEAIANALKKRQGTDGIFGRAISDEN